MIQIDNDQSAVIEKFDPSLHRNWAHCGTDWCSVAVYGPGTFGTNPGVLWVKDSNISAQCAFNGIDNQDANALRVSDTVVQSYPQFGIRAAGNANNVAAILDNVHLEVGDCTNPLGVGIAGLISEGFFSVLHGTGAVGQVQQFGSTQTSPQLYAYYVVIHGSIGDSAPYLVGWAYQIPPITVKWVQPPSPNGGTLTYDLLRQSVANLGNTTAAPYGTGNYKVTTTLSCTAGICSATDTGGATTSYPVVAPSTYAPALTFWPGAVVLTELTDSATNNGAEPRLYTDIVGQGTGIPSGGFVNSYGANVPTVFAQQCSAPGAWSSIWMSCPAGDSVSSGYAPVGALVLQYGTVASSGEGGGLKGRLNFLMSPNTPTGNSSPATHLITLGDSNAAKTLATPGHRPQMTLTTPGLGWTIPTPTKTGFSSPSAPRSLSPATSARSGILRRTRRWSGCHPPQRHSASRSTQQ